MKDGSVAKGSCLCGAVSVTTAGMSDRIGACHCSMCRKWGGGALLVVECESNTNFIGEENIGVYQSSEWAERGFCKKCGSHLFYRLKQSDRYFIPVGIFENTEGLIFDNQVFIDEKPHYYSFANETQNLTGAELLEQFDSSSEK
jgi:hypothetical protein